MSKSVSQYENPQNINEYYLAILKRLVKQKALEPELIVPEKKETNLNFLQKVCENIFSQMKLDKMLFECSLKEILNNKHLEEDLSKRNFAIQVMTFSQLILYKTLPCPRGQICNAKPREIAPYNQYSDKELSCVFYHHHKDRRRIPITPRIRDEFLYKANYDKKKDVPNNAKYSRNYFESIYHPIYYKLFKCKRVGCNQSYHCPFNHCETEKLLWDEIFQMYFLKKREIYTGKNYSLPLKALSKTPFETDLFMSYCDKADGVPDNNYYAGEDDNALSQSSNDTRTKDLINFDKLALDSSEDDLDIVNCPTLDSLSLTKDSFSYNPSPALSITRSPKVSIGPSPVLSMYSKQFQPNPSHIIEHQT